MVSSLFGWFGDAQHEASLNRNDNPPRSSSAAQPGLSVQSPGAWAQAWGHASETHVSSTEHVLAAAAGTPRLNLGAGAALPRIAERFREVGAAVLEELRGPFALALYDRDRKRGLLAVDRMGIGVLFVQATDKGLAFGRAPTRVARLAGVPLELAPQALFDYLYSHVVPAPHSIVAGPRRLLPGEAVTWENGRTEFRRYWRVAFEENRPRPFEELKSEFRSLLRVSVADAMAGAKAGAFLSGGTDSSTIVGMMREVTGQPPESFSIGFDATGYDEMEFARTAARHFGSNHHEYYVTPADIVAAVPQLARTHDQPFGNASAAPTYYCALRAREQGCEVMLGGDGGDELFGGNARYALQHIFGLYENIPGVLRHALIEPVAGLIARGPRIPLVSSAAGYVQQARTPMPARLESYNLLERLGRNEVLHESLAARIDPREPIALLESEYFNPTAASLINRMLALDLKTTLADSDLPKVNRSCELAGIPVRFPMLDERIVDFSATLEPSLKLRGRTLRYFFKEALRDFLPEQTITKKKQGFGLPFGYWAVRDDALRQLTFDSLNALKKRSLVRSEFIDRLKDELMPAHPGYYGTMAWILMMLELWLQEHFDSHVSTTARVS
jgi:asparagine synthase (glutamine-hydrolysing)